MPEDHERRGLGAAEVLAVVERALGALRQLRADGVGATRIAVTSREQCTEILTETLAGWDGTEVVVLSEDGTGYRIRKDLVAENPPSGDNVVVSADGNAALVVHVSEVVVAVKR